MNPGKAETSSSAPCKRTHNIEPETPETQKRLKYDNDNNFCYTCKKNILTSHVCKPCICPNCKEAFATLDDSLKHKCTPFKCDICGKGLKTKLILQRHKTLTHKIGIKIEYPCKLCNKYTTPRKSDLYKHIQSGKCRKARLLAMNNHHTDSRDRIDNRVSRTECCTNYSLISSGITRVLLLYLYRSYNILADTSLAKVSIKHTNHCQKL